MRSVDFTDSCDADAWELTRSRANDLVGSGGDRCVRVGCSYVAVGIYRGSDVRV